MKVVHVVGGGLDGGAARGALWLHEALLRQGIASSLLSQYGPPAPGITTFAGNPAKKLKQMALGLLDNLPFRLYTRRDKIPYATGFFGNRILSEPVVREADIVHCHWINGGTLSIFSLSKFKKPVVWTLRDMWPLTGGCHYSLSCDRYKLGCGECQYLKSNVAHDLTRFVFTRKRRAYARADLHPVAISQWLADCAEESGLFADVSVIPNGVDPAVFCPIEKPVARNILGLPANRPIVLAGAQSLNDFYKGFPQYLKAIPIIAEDKQPFFLFFGKLDANAIPLRETQFRSLGLLKDDISLRLAYSAADVFVAPSTQEAFGKTIIEAMACGTPVVAFRSTGPQDIITHESDGYLAQPYDPRSLAAGIRFLLDRGDHTDFIRAPRNTVLRQFTIDLVAAQYRELYNRILATGNASATPRGSIPGLPDFR